MRYSFIALVALAAVPAAARNDPPELIPDGEPVNCIQMSQIRDTTVHNDTTIDFRMRNGTVFRNVLPRSCPNLGFQRSFGYHNSTGQLCSVDVITVVQTGAGPTRGATCGLGQFAPMKAAPAAEK